MRDVSLSHDGLRSVEGLIVEYRKLSMRLSSGKLVNESGESIEWDMRSVDFQLLDKSTPYVKGDRS